MKVISGLDWLEEKIHYPEKLIDFCINNKPKHEGCDVVDYIYVLTKCSKQTNYKKEAVARILVECIFKCLYFTGKKREVFRISLIVPKLIIMESRFQREKKKQIYMELYFAHGQ